MELSSETEGRICVISVAAPRIDMAGALAFKDDMRRLTVAAPEVVILDLGAVSFIDSSGLGAIVAIMKHLAPERELVLAGLTPHVEKVFRLTRMDSVFRLFSRLEDARAAVQTSVAGG
ncbi:STAS domain-containing protein [Sulfitobacter aestuarii]|uniref:STAS domain-containing protein n=1 Tax=Sulfitobacter aestuarii TaxID=2161676 RepID=A0ABW5U4Q6_9RHOB